MTGKGSENKQIGSFYTPAWCVDIMMDIAKFDERFRSSEHSLKVMDPACGDGAILVQACIRMIRLMQEDGSSSDDIAMALTESLYGIEIEPGEAEKARRNVADAAKAHGVELSADDIKVFIGDAFDVAPRFYGFFDFVIGNPPYVRIHNLKEKPDSPYIEGMCDLYLGFYDLGQRLLCDGGRLVFIAPSSWMTSRAGRAMREDLKQRCAIRSLLDFKHYQVFDNATTYTAIVVIDAVRDDCEMLDDERQENDEIDLYRFVGDDKSFMRSGSVPQIACWFQDGFYAVPSEELYRILRFSEDTIEDEKKRERTEKIVVRNGYATLHDKTYISHEPRFGGKGIEIKMIKAAKAQEMYGVYPYSQDGTLISLETIKNDHPDVYELLMNDEEALLARNKIDAMRWWGYGRTQGISDTYEDKITIQSIVRPDKKILTCSAPAGIGVFGGIYVMGMKEDDLRTAISDSAFWIYVEVLAKYKSGGYYTFGGKELERYLRWWASRE